MRISYWSSYVCSSDLTLPVWRRPGSSAPATASEPVAQASVGQEAPASEAKTQRLLVGVPTPGQALTEWTLPITPTLVASPALTTRDFQDMPPARAPAHSYGSTYNLRTTQTSQTIHPNKIQP